MSFRLQSIAFQTAHVFTFLADEAPRGAALRRPNLLAGRLEIANGVKWTFWNLVDEQFDAGRELLADVEAACALLVVPIEAVPIRPMAKSSGRALLASEFAAPHVLLAVDDSIRPASPITQVGTSCPFERHAKSLHKSLWLASHLLGGVGW